MSVAFYPYVPTKSERCPYCQEDIVQGQAGIVAHSDLNGRVVVEGSLVGVEGSKHFYHKTCIDVFQNKGNCPSCKVPFDQYALLSWKEKCIVELKCIINDTFRGAQFAGLPYGLAGLAVASTVSINEIALHVFKTAFCSIGSFSGLSGTLNDAEKALWQNHLLFGKNCVINLISFLVLEKKIERTALSCIVAAGIAFCMSPEPIREVQVNMIWPLASMWQASSIAEALTEATSELFEDRLSLAYRGALSVLSCAFSAGIIGAMTGNMQLAAAMSTVVALKSFENRAAPSQNLQLTVGGLTGFGVAAAGYAVRASFFLMSESTQKSSLSQLGVISRIGGGLIFTGAMLNAGYGIYHRGKWLSLLNPK